MTDKKAPATLSDADLDQAGGGALYVKIDGHDSEIKYSFDLVNKSDINTSDTKFSTTLNDSQLKWTR